jgi:hypothetical protein
MYVFIWRDRRGRYRMLGKFIATYAISPYYHKSCEFECRWMQMCTRYNIMW